MSILVSGIEPEKLIVELRLLKEGAAGAADDKLIIDGDRLCSIRLAPPPYFCPGCAGLAIPVWLKSGYEDRKP